MGFTERNLPMRRSDAEKHASVSSAPSPAHGDTHAVVDHFVDVALKVRERRPENLQLSLKVLPSPDWVPALGKVRGKVFCKHLLVCRCGIGALEDHRETPGEHVGA